MSNPKVPIPRLERREKIPPKAPAPSRGRVSRACLNCRARKVKCNGAQPRCRSCEMNDMTCTYTSSRKDRLKTATEQNQHMLSLLRDLHRRVGPTERTRIEDAITSVSADVAEAAVGSTDTPESAPTEDTQDDERGEASVSIETETSEHIPMAHRGPSHGKRTRTLSYADTYSENSLLSLPIHEPAHRGLRNAYQETFQVSGENVMEATRSLAPEIISRHHDPATLVVLNDLNFYLDDQKLNIDYMVNDFEVPSFATAERLLNCYMTTVHDSFPIIPKETLVDRFYQYYASLDREAPQNTSHRWLGMLNLVFAIGAAYSHLAEEPWRADAGDALAYHSRARALTLKDPFWFSHPGLPQLQINALLAFYYLAIGHVNRSWMVSGMALRSSFALGLHLQDEDVTVSAVMKETIARIWWGLYCLESILSSLTGRPSITFPCHITAPLPVPLSTEDINESSIASLFGHTPRSSYVPDFLDLDEDSSHDGSTTPRPNLEPANSGSFLKATVRLNAIMQRVLSKLYVGNIGKGSWKEMQDTIGHLDDQLEEWASSLPVGFSLSHGNRLPRRRERTILEFHYLGAKMLITRPCLCRSSRRETHHNNNAHMFDHKTAETCVQSAKDFSARLPDEPERDRSQIYQLGPWWSTVHSIMQSLTILMLQLSFHDIGYQRNDQDLVTPAKKLMSWLKVMSNENAMASRAHGMMLSVLNTMSIHFETDISGLIDDDTPSPMQTTPPRPQQTSMSNSTNSTGIYESHVHATEVNEHHTSHSQGVFPASNPFQLSDEQLTFLNGEFDDSTTSSDYLPNFLPQNTTLSNLLVTMHDEENPFSIPRSSWHEP